MDARNERIEPNMPADAPSGSERPPKGAPNSRRTALGWVLVGAWAVFIFCMSANTGSGLDQGSGLVSQIYQALKDLQAHLLGPSIDVVNPIAHFCEYTVFGALLTNAWRAHQPLRRAVLLAIVCASLYGVTDELHQYFVPGRACDPADWLVDTCGAALGALLYACGFSGMARSTK